MLPGAMPASLLELSGSYCLVEVVAAGRAPVDLNLQMLMDGRLDIALDWNRP